MTQIKQWQNVLDRLRYWHTRDEAMSDAMESFCAVLAPDNYPPFVPGNSVPSFLEGFCGEDKELKDILEYWLYEAPLSEATDFHVQCKNKKWNFNKDEEVIDYLCQFYPDKFKK